MKGHPRDVCARRGCGHRRIDHRWVKAVNADGSTAVEDVLACAVERGGLRVDTCPRFLERDEEQPAQGAHRDTRPIRAQRTERREMKPLLRGGGVPKPVPVRPLPSRATTDAPRRRWWVLPAVGVVLLIALCVGTLLLVGYLSERAQPVELPPITTPTATTPPVFEPTLDQVLDGYWWVALQRRGLVDVAPDQQLSIDYARSVCTAIDADPTVQTVEAQIGRISTERNARWEAAQQYVALATEVYCPTYAVLLS